LFAERRNAVLDSDSDRLGKLNWEEGSKRNRAQPGRRQKTEEGDYQRQFQVAAAPLWEQE